MINLNCKGRIRIAHELLRTEEGQNSFKLILKDAIVLETHIDYAQFNTLDVSYILIHPKFRELKEGEHIPLYDIQLQKDENDNVSIRNIIEASNL